MKSCTEPGLVAPVLPFRLRLTLTLLLAPGSILYHQDCPGAEKELLKAGPSTAIGGRSTATVSSEMPLSLAEFWPTNTSPRSLATTSQR